MKQLSKAGGAKPHLDEIDLKILAALQNNGRLTNVALSESTGLSPPPCLRRLQTLENSGHIRAYHAELDAKKLGFHILAFVFVGLKAQTDKDVKIFERTVRTWSNVRECYAVTGVADFLLKCVAHDLGSLQDFVTKTLMATPNVTTVKTTLAIHAVKDLPDVPLFEV